MEERRRQARLRVLKAGRIAVSDKAPRLECTVRNISAVGACIELASGTFGIPSAFTLILASGPQPCRVVWRTERRLGVVFADPAEPARVLATTTSG